MSEVKTAVEAWESAIGTLELSTKAMGAAIKMMNGSRSNAMLQKSWEAVEATRDALVVAQADEAAKFKAVIAFNNQQVIDFSKPEGAKPEPKPGGPKLHPQEPLALPPGPVPGAESDSGDPDGEEGVDSTVDDDEDEPEAPAPAPESNESEDDEDFDPDADDDPEEGEKP